MSRIDVPRGATRSRWSLIGIAALFVVPVLISWVMFRTMDLWWSGDTRNYGDLITPARPIELGGLQAEAGGEPFDSSFLRGRWTLIVLAAKPQDLPTRESLYLTRQVRTALEKDQERVQRVLILEASPEPAIRDELVRIDPGLMVTVASAGSLAKIRRELAPDTDAAGEGSVYVVDPLGNLMMRYPAGADGKLMLKDLRRLLKVSQIG